MIGGLTGEDLAEARGAEWIILRHSIGSREERRVQQWLRNELSPARHRRIEIDYPDTQFENREDPRIHRFRSAPATVPRVVVFERRG